MQKASNQASSFFMFFSSVFKRFSAVQYGNIPLSVSYNNNIIKGGITILKLHNTKGFYP